MLAKDYYVTLTGGKNNAGDFLIKYRAKKLMAEYRPDREIVDLDGWKPFGEEELTLVNNSKALILLGGPALQEKMRPRVYGLTENLQDIKVPIVMMGVGWYSQEGRWEHTHDYPMNQKSKELLKRMADDGLMSSVRDYHTLNTLASMGYSNYLMTGCPALYSLPHIGTEVANGSPKKIGFSLGVSLKASNKMRKQMQQAILKTIEVFSDSEVEVVFHHGIGENYLKSDGVASDLYVAQRKFIEWLEEESIKYVDISGSAENLIEYYNTCDLHIGYRVHAHIFCNSISKPSVLLNEDGRGIALRDVIGGATLDMYKKAITHKAAKAAHKLKVPFDNMKPAKGAIKDYGNLLRYEIASGVKLQQPRRNIDLHSNVMKRFILQLP